MLMRFHWGLAVGHVYAHRQSCTNVGVIWGDTNQRFRSGAIHKKNPEPPELTTTTTTQEDLHEPGDLGDVDVGPDSGTDGSGSESDASDSDYRPSDGEDDQSSDENEDEDWLDVDEMYGQGDSDDDSYEG